MRTEGRCKGAGQAEARRIWKLPRHSGLANDPIRLKRLKDQLQLAKSMVEIDRAEQAKKADKRAKASEGLFDVPLQLLKNSKQMLGRVEAYCSRD